LKHENSFDFIRFIAAGMVVFSHSFALAGLTEPKIGNMGWGGVGVWIFFILSGYLIASSWYQYPRFNVFFVKRALRIFPGLFVAILITIVVTGLFFTTMGIVSFFNSQDTYNYLNNIFLFNTQYSLPGAFAANHYPNAVNGSLWTLAYEFLMYVAVGVFGVIGVLKKNGAIKLWTLLFGLQLLVILTGWNIFTMSFFYFQLDLIIMLGLMFFTGVLAYKYIKKIPLKPRVGVVSLLAYIALSTLLPSLSAIFAAIFLAYAIFSLGSLPYMSWFGRKGDFSYGIYIYSFPIQQMVVAITGTSNQYKLFALSMALSVIAGIISWNLIESRALKLKTKINLKKYPLKQADVAW
jgi:peptidoglycan/LPS O-acetylase OafA/YrhL